MRKSLLCSVVMLLAETCVSWAEAPSRRAIIELPKCGLCAHRGAMSTHPENTLSSFREAIRCGAHMIEFDVRLTKDKKLVIMHDVTVDRTTDGKGKVSDLTFDEIRQLDAGSWKSPAFKGEKVPDLEETLAMMPINTWLNVHLGGGRELGRRVAGVIVRQGRLHQAFLACVPSAAEGAREVEPKILICNMYRRPNVQDYVDGTLRMKAAFIQLKGAISPKFSDYTKQLKKNGVRINYFGTDSPKRLRSLFELGVEFPLVNRIDASMKVAEELGMQRVHPIFRDETPGGTGH